MNLRWITLFAAIAEEGSFTRAATKLNVAQPWLSAQLRKLEYELGVQLLIRENIGVRVTEAGERLLPHAQQLAESARMFRQIARSLGETQSRVVKLGSHLPIIDVPSLKAITLEFTSKYENFELNASTNGTNELIKALEDSALDFVLIPAPLPDGAPDLECRRLSTAHICLLSPKKRAVNSLKAAKGETVGIPPRNWDPALYQRLVAALEEAGVTAREVPEFDRRAVEHSVLAHGAIVATVIDDGDDLDMIDPLINVVQFDELRLEHLLCRISKRHLGRAAERFWGLAAAASEQLAG